MVFGTLSLVTIALTVSVTTILTHIIIPFYNLRKNRKEMKKEALLYCQDIENILNDYINKGIEEEYSIELDLASYYKDHQQDMFNLSQNLLESNKWYYPKDQKMLNLGNMLKWISHNNFYDTYLDEDERIKKWSKNVPLFYTKLIRLILPFTERPKKVKIGVAA